jgi:hypothetical protein
MTGHAGTSGLACPERGHVTRHGPAGRRCSSFAAIRDRKGVSRLRIHPRKRIFVSAAIVVAAALGCRSMVAAQTPAGGPSPEMYAPVPPASQVQTVTGTVTQVIAYAYPGGLTIQTPDGAFYTYRVVSATAITRVNRATGFSGPVALSAIQPGDAVTVTADPTGTAQTVQALSDPAAQTRPYVPAPPVVRATTGTVAQVNAFAYPGQLTVQLPDGNLYTYRVLPRTAITRTNTTTGRGGSVPLGAIQAGDAATVTADQGGMAESIQAAFVEITGTIARFVRDRITLRDGHTYRLDSTAQISRFGQVLTSAALQPGATVTLRVNPETRRVYGVALLQAPSARAISPVAVPSGGRHVDAPVITSRASGPAVTAPFTVDAKGNWSATFSRPAPAPR